MSDDADLRKIVGDVAAAYFSNSHVTLAEIPAVIQQIAASLRAVGQAPAEEAPPEGPGEIKLTPAKIRKSISREALISFEDGKPYKTLRRHLATRGLTPEAYKAKWGLPKDYPMVSPAYSEARSKMAKAIGLGARAPARAAPAAASKAPRKAPTRTRKPKATTEAAGAA